MHFLRVIKGSHTPLGLRDKGFHRDRESSHAMNPYPLLRSLICFITYSYRYLEFD